MEEVWTSELIAECAKDWDYGVEILSSTHWNGEKWIRMRPVKLRDGSVLKAD